MNRTSRTKATKRVLTTVALAALWLAGAGGGFAADAPTTPAKQGATPAASPDGSVATNDAAPWQLIEVPGAWGKRSKKNLGGDAHTVWYRAFVHVPANWKGESLVLQLGKIDDCDEAHVNGVKVGATGRFPPNYQGASGKSRRYTVPAEHVRADAYNLIAVRLYNQFGDGGIWDLGDGGVWGDQLALSCKKGRILLTGDWQFRTGDDPAWAHWPQAPDSAQGKRLAESFRESSIQAAGAPWKNLNQVVFEGEAQPPEGSLVMWYRKPAAQWVEALPLGNGRLGAMVFGGVSQERLQLNEDTLWGGRRRDHSNPKALAALPEVRRLVFEGKHKEAEKLAGASGLSGDFLTGEYSTLGDLKINTPGIEAVTNYRRDLDLDTGIATVSYTAKGVSHRQDVFVSAPDQVLVVRFEASAPGKISKSLTMSRQEDAVCESVGSDRIILNYGTNYAAVLRAIPTGGKLKNARGVLQIEDADALTLILSAATTYRGGNPVTNCHDLITKTKPDYTALRTAHITEHRGLFRRVELDLGTNDFWSRLPTDSRLANPSQDPGLATLYFQFGRYLLMSSSRPGSLPANLQGIWNEGLSAVWHGDFHPNINLQMNYWPAEVANLAECHRPLFDWMEALVESGTRTAKGYYNCGGWTLHHASDPWGYTAPAGFAWPMGGAWLCQHVYEHYRFGGDRDYLARHGYPLMQGAAQFLLDYLVEAPAGTPVAGRLVTNPSHSPENLFKKADGSSVMITYGATMDLQIVHDLFTNTIEASEILGRDEEFRAKLKAALARLVPLQISQKTGRLQEWIEDYEELEPGHRHLSHLFGLHPGSQITLYGTPELAAAARKSLEGRVAHGSGQHGWSRAWIISLWARLGDGNRAAENVRTLLARFTLPNLFDKCPPFQIDGNFGGAAGIAEMLIQSHAGEIQILPALPEAWPAGRVKGLRARGGFELSFAWKEKKLSGGSVLSRLGGICRIRAPGEINVSLNGKPLEVKRPAEGIVVFETNAGAVYELQ